MHSAGMQRADAQTVYKCRLFDGEKRTRKFVCFTVFNVELFAACCPLNAVQTKMRKNCTILRLCNSGTVSRRNDLSDVGKWWIDRYGL